MIIRKEQYQYAVTPTGQTAHSKILEAENLHGDSITIEPQAFCGLKEIE